MEYRDGSFASMDDGGLSDDDDISSGTGGRGKAGGSKLTTEAKYDIVYTNIHLFMYNNNAVLLLYCVARRSQHCEVEKRRRERMNRYMNELAQMIPTCAAVPRRLDKLSILKMAVDHMKSLRGNSVGWGLISLTHTHTHTHMSYHH